MQSYDLVMLVVLVGATLFGAMKGLAWQIASIASLVASYFAAFHFRDRVAPMISADESWNRFGAMLVIYACSSAGIWMIFRVIAGFIDSFRLKDFDRQMGAIFGFVKGVLLCVVITFFAVTLLGNMRETILNSRSGHYIAVLLDKAHPIMPEEIHKVLDPYIVRLEKELEAAHPNPSHTHDSPGPINRSPAPIGPSRVAPQTSPQPSPQPSPPPSPQPSRQPGFSLPPWRSADAPQNPSNRSIPAAPTSTAPWSDRVDETLRDAQGAVESIRQAGEKWNDLRRTLTPSRVEPAPPPNR